MKKHLIFTGLLAVCFSSLCSCKNGQEDNFKATNSDNFDIIPLCGEAYDYSDNEMWMYKDVSAKYKVDLVYFYPSVVETPSNSNAIAEVNKLMKASAHYALAETASCFGYYTNVFAPYYAQLPINPDMAAVAEYAKRYGIT